MKKKKIESVKPYLIPIILLMGILTSCNDAISWENDGDKPLETENTGMYILCEGLFNMNNSTLAYYDFEQRQLVTFQDPDKKGTDKTNTDYFKKQNKRKLGDTANDLQRYGSKIYCAVNVSSQIEIMDAATGISFKQIPLFTDQGIGREPRFFAFHKNKAYVCCFDDYVARIDTSSLEVDALVRVGRDPDGICVANNKLYVSNSGGLNPENPDSTVSVIDIASFTEIKKIPVRKNLGTILSDAAGNVYVVSREKFNYDIMDYNCQLHRIDSEKDQVVETFDRPILSFTISGYRAYMYSYNSSIEAIQIMDTRTGEMIDDNFIKDGTKITRTYHIDVNPINGDVLICDALDYTVPGNILCFDQQGRYKYKITRVGINPNSIIFLNK